MKKYLHLLLILIIVVFIGCGKKDDNPVGGDPSNTDIPEDPASAAPVPVINNITPSAPAPAKVPGNPNRIMINLIGVIDPVTEQQINLVANQSLFVVEDSKNKGILVSSAGGSTTLNADVVFVVDNSGSMGEEADSIASKIIAFVNYLQAYGINLKVGCVGYDGSIYGGVNLTDAVTLKNYLNRPYYTGTSRTVGFAGPDSSVLYNAANNFSYTGGENGILGICFADTFFSWRSNSARVYINFTDEGTQPDYYGYYCNESLKSRWKPEKGTIHTVFSLSSSYWNGAVPDTSSEKENYSDWNQYYERPWAVSWFSGGTIKFVHSDATDLDLTALPVTGVLANSVKVEFLTADPNAVHDLEIIIKNASTPDGKTTFNNITY
ncbi:MAG: hypothetical protein ACM34M_07795 [Ignavibacteria bacterium]